MGLGKTVRALFPKVPKRLLEMDSDELRKKGYRMHERCQYYEKIEADYEQMKKRVNTYKF